MNKSHLQSNLAHKRWSSGLLPSPHEHPTVLPPHGVLVLCSNHIPEYCCRNSDHWVGQIQTSGLQLSWPEGSISLGGPFSPLQSLFYPSPHPSKYHHILFPPNTLRKQKLSLIFWLVSPQNSYFEVLISKHACIWR